MKKSRSMLHGIKRGMTNSGVDRKNLKEKLRSVPVANSVGSLSLYLIDPLVGDDGEGRGVVEDVVVAVLLPEGEVDVAEAVVEELVKVRPSPDHRPRQQVLPNALRWLFDVTTPCSDNLMDVVIDLLT